MKIGVAELTRVLAVDGASRIHVAIPVLILHCSYDFLVFDVTLNSHNAFFWASFDSQQNRN